MSDPISLVNRTPARILAGRSGTSYKTETALHLRVDHASAVDAVRDEVDSTFLRDLGLVDFRSLARDRSEYLLRPDLGRRLHPEDGAAIRREFPREVELQVVVGDGLSAAAVVRQVPELLPRLKAGATERGWSQGRPFFVRQARVGLLNDIGEATGAAVVVLLIGERPGLATAESLSAYLAYRPHHPQTDADRNLISNIHGQGISPEAAAHRILALVDQMILRKLSGVAVKEGLHPRLA
jgi:ethanolamine ammonia-lyase small subunit